MTELEVKENIFYVLSVKQEKERRITLYNDMDSPVLRVKEYIKGGTNPEDIELMVVDVKEEKFEIKSVPWSMIAVRLIKE